MSYTTLIDRFPSANDTVVAADVCLPASAGDGPHPIVPGTSLRLHELPRT